MKPLTIEELKSLKVGDWVWIKFEIDNPIDRRYAKQERYFQIIEPKNDTTIRFNNYAPMEYADYGKTWLAYKNKEQANGELEIVRNETEKELAAYLLKQIKKNATDVHFTNYDECGKAVSLTVAESLMTEIKKEAKRRLAELKGDEI